MISMKGVCIAVGAMLVFGAMSASAAQATELFYEAGEAPNKVTLSGENAKGKDVMKMEGLKVECKTGLHEIVNTGVSTFELHPTFSECKAFGFVEATVNPEKCMFRYNLKEKLEVDVFRSEMDVNCPAGESIKVSGGTCKAEIKSQNGLQNVKFIDMTAAPADLTIKYEITKFAYTVTQDGALCPFAGVGAKADGEYTTNESMTLQGTDPNNAKTIIPIQIK